MPLAKPLGYSEIIEVHDFRHHGGDLVFEPDGEVGFEEFEALLQFATSAVHRATAESRREIMLDQALVNASVLARELFDVSDTAIFDLGQRTGITLEPRSARFHDRRAESEITTNTEGLRFVTLRLALDSSELRTLETDVKPLELVRAVYSVGTAFELGRLEDGSSYHFSVLKGLQNALPYLKNRDNLGEFATTGGIAIPLHMSADNLSTLYSSVDHVNHLVKEGMAFDGTNFYGKAWVASEPDAPTPPNPLLSTEVSRAERAPNDYFNGLARAEDIVLNFKRAYVAN